MSTRAFPHPIVLEQIRAPAPHLLALFAFYFVPSWLPTLLTRGLIDWPAFATFRAHHHSQYQLAFLALQSVLLFGSIIILSTRYPRAIWIRRPPFGRNTNLCACLLLPILLYHLSSWNSTTQLLETLSKLHNPSEARRVLAYAHTAIWSRLAGGPSLTGVVSASILSLTAPVLEEMVFSGFVANAILRSFGVTAALLGTPVCFALTHVVQFGFGPHLVPLFFAGLTCTGIRFVSGNLRWAIFSHLLVNIVIMAPKWTIAYLHFNWN